MAISNPIRMHVRRKFEHLDEAISGLGWLAEEHELADKDNLSIILRPLYNRVGLVDGYEISIEYTQEVSDER